jgi:hypothetical protein
LCILCCWLGLGLGLGVGPGVGRHLDPGRLVLGLGRNLVVVGVARCCCGLLGVALGLVPSFGRELGPGLAYGLLGVDVPLGDGLGLEFGVVGRVLRRVPVSYVQNSHLEGRAARC